MKKATRDLKKHYRGIERELRNISVDLSEVSWYSLWHLHLDWDGITTRSIKQRRIHIQYYLKILEIIDKQAKEIQDIKFQTWIYLDSQDGVDDAIYFHTENPNTDFPYLRNIKWDIDVPILLVDVLDLSKFSIGTIISEKDQELSYFIQNRESGLSINSNDL